MSPLRKAQSEQAALHYLRGNRFSDLRAGDLAVAEWRRANLLWHGAPPRRAAGFLLELRAILMLLMTVLLIYNTLYLAFPRDAVDLLGAGDSVESQDAGSWWGDWVGGDGQGARKGGIAAWWRSLVRKLTPPGREQNAQAAPTTVKGQWEQLLVQYGKLGLVNPSDLDFHLIAGYGLSRQGEHQLAISAFEQGLLATHNPKRLADLYQGLANAFYAQGYHLGADGLARYDLQEMRKAARAYEAASQADARSLSFGNLGWMYYLLGRYDQAEQNSRRALAMDGSLDYVRLNLGLILLVQGRTQDAYQIYREVIGGKPEDEVFSGGMNDLRELLRDQPGRYPHADLMLGLLAAGQGDTARARQALTRFLAARGLEPRWRQVATDALAGLNRVREASPRSAEGV